MPTFDRREFLLALGAGVPFALQGCGDAESAEFRAGEVDFDVAPPLMPLAGTSKGVQIRRALTTQPFIGDEQGCSVAKSVAVAVGDQIRITRKSTEYAIYTVEQKREQDDPNRVRLGLDARLRLGSGNEFSATLTTPVVAQGLTEAQAEAASEFIECLDDDGQNQGLIAIAPHGGAIEPCTDLQAEAVRAAFGCSSWCCKGWKAGGGAYERWHITSTKLSPNSFPRLGQIADRGYAYAVAFHGMATGGVLIGGRAPLEIRQMVRAAIVDELGDSSISVSIATAADQFSGDAEANVVNWLTADGFGGVQVEQDRVVRLEHWQEVVAGVISAFEQLI